MLPNAISLITFCTFHKKGSCRRPNFSFGLLFLHLTHPRAHTHTHTHFLSLSYAHPQTQPHMPSHARLHALYVSHTHLEFLSLSLSLSRFHSLTHKNSLLHNFLSRSSLNVCYHSLTRTLSHTHIHTLSLSSFPS